MNCRTRACQQRRWDLWRANNEDRVALSLLGQGAEVLSIGVPLPGLGWLGRLCGCFEEGTLVATPEGLRPIEEIEIGDQVLAWNPEAGATTTETVTALIRPEPKLLWRLEVRDGNGEIETFFVTDDHPWYVEGVGWIETRRLRAGQHIETADDRGLTIVDVVPTDRVARTFNLAVTGPHTFLVGEDGAVVHNTGLCARIFRHYERQLAQHGRRSLERSLRTLERRVREHQAAAARYRAAGGHTSSVEREIQAFEAQIAVIREILGRGP